MTTDPAHILPARRCGQDFPEPDSDPSRVDYQHLENLATAYWRSEVLFSALELNVFDHIEAGTYSTQDLCRVSSCPEPELLRLLRVLQKLELIGEHDGIWTNFPLARFRLVRGNPGYMGDFLLYRRYMQDSFRTLTDRIRRNPVQADRTGNQVTEPETDYETRNFRYVRALDQLAREKAGEIAAILSREAWHLPVLDIGGGAGSTLRTLLQHRKTAQGHHRDDAQEFPAVLLDLPEVIQAATRIYPNTSDWDGIQAIGGDFRFLEENKFGKFGLILLCNFLHAYGKTDAKELLAKAVRLLRPNGRILIHDYFPDRSSRFPHTGALYDLAMMLNTYDGTCHDASRVVSWLESAGITRHTVIDLHADSSVIVAGYELSDNLSPSPEKFWSQAALLLGFRRAVPISVEKIATAPWAKWKCRYGCAGFGKNLRCPPHGIPYPDMIQMLKSYRRAILLEGSPPGTEFHEKLLALEKQAFLAGFHRAFVLGAGPCPVCSPCPGVGECRHPDVARPSLEGSGIDVFQTAHHAGLHLAPVTDPDGYVKYLGLLLLE